MAIMVGRIEDSLKARLDHDFRGPGGSASDSVTALELAAMLLRMDEHQLAAFRAYYDAEAEKHVGYRGGSCSGESDFLESQVSEPELTSEVSVRSSVSTARARKRAKARVRKAKLKASQACTEVSYTVSASVRDELDGLDVEQHLVLGYCYLSMFKKPFWGYLKNRLGPHPAFSELLSMSSNLLEEGWSSLMVSRSSAETYHFSVAGMVSLDSCLKSIVHDCKELFESGSVAAMVDTTDVASFQHLVVKRPRLEDTVGSWIPQVFRGRYPFNFDESALTIVDVDPPDGSPCNDVKWLFSGTMPDGRNYKFGSVNSKDNAGGHVGIYVGDLDGNADWIIFGTDDGLVRANIQDLSECRFLHYPRKTLFASNVLLITPG